MDKRTREKQAQQGRQAQHNKAGEYLDESTDDLRMTIYLDAQNVQMYECAALSKHGYRNDDAKQTCRPFDPATVVPIKLMTSSDPSIVDTG